MSRPAIGQHASGQARGLAQLYRGKPRQWFIVAAVLAVPLGSLVWMYFERAGATSAPLHVDPKNLIYGEAWNTDRFPLTLPVTNISGAVVQVARFEGGCYCTRVEPRSFRIEPGETVDVRLTLDLTVRDPNRAAMQWRDHSELVSAFGQADSVHALGSWTITGRVHSAFRVDPENVDFGDSLVEDATFPERAVDVFCHEPCRDLNLDCDPALAAVYAEPTGAQDGRQFRVHITPKATLPVGAHQFHVGIGAVLASGQATPGVPLSVAARVVPDLAIRPSFSHLGEVAIGSEIQRTYSLESRTGRRFVVERIDCQSPDVEIEELSSPDDNRIKPMRLTVRPSIAGDSAAEIRFIVRAEGTADRVLGEISQSVVLRLRYQGTARK